MNACCLYIEMTKIIFGIYLWTHVCIHSNWSNPFTGDTLLVSCTMINLTISSHRVTCTQLYVAIPILNLAYKVLWGHVNPNLSNSIDLPIIEYRNVILMHTMMVCFSVSA